MLIRHSKCNAIYAKIHSSTLLFSTILLVFHSLLIRCFRLNENGQFDRIAFNNVVRSDFINAPANQIYALYEAYYKLFNMLHEEKYALFYKMTEGDIIVFNNKRVLHGRTAFDPQITTRELCGMYLDWDDTKSVFRVLKKKLSL